MSRKYRPRLKPKANHDGWHPHTPLIEGKDTYELPNGTPVIGFRIPVRADDYNDLLSELYSPGNWFQCSFDCFEVMDLDEAVVWSFLLGQDRRRREKSDYDGWFDCSLHYVSEKFPMIGERRQYRILNFLKAQKLLKVKKVGVPARRYFQLNLELFRDLVLVARAGRSRPDKTAESVCDKTARSYSLLRRELTKNRYSRTRTSLREGPHPAGNQTMGPFKPRANRDKNKKGPTTVITQLAKDLRKFGASKSWPTSRSPRSWETPLQILADQVGEDNVTTALKWYMANHPKEFGMKLMNGKEFREHYHRVLHRMESCKAEHVKVERALKPLIADMKGWGWPKDSKKQVGVACQMTLEIIRNFRKRLQKSEAWLAKYLLDGGMPTPLGFVEEWMRRVHKRVQDWDDWHGNLLKEVPKPPDDKRFNSWGREIAEEATSAKAWDKLIQEVY